MIEVHAQCGRCFNNWVAKVQSLNSVAPSICPVCRQKMEDECEVSLERRIVELEDRMAELENSLATMQPSCDGGCR